MRKIIEILGTVLLAVLILSIFIAYVGGIAYFVSKFGVAMLRYLFYPGL